MDAVRYGLALTLLVATPPAFLTWFLIHPFIGLWRRLGPVWTYLLISIPILGLGYLLYRSRGTLLAVDWGPHPVAIALGVLCLGVSIPMAVQVRKQLSLSTLVGLPEVDPQHHRGELLCEGIYARMRHPRYVEGMLGVLGFSLLANRPVLYGMVAVLAIGLYAIALLEERELRERFGEAYEEYSRRVPRFIPRIRDSAGSAPDREHSSGAGRPLDH